MKWKKKEPEMWKNKMKNQNNQMSFWIQKLISFFSFLWKE